MKFRLLDRDGKDEVHSGVMARLKPAQTVTWGNRAFLRTASDDDGATYRETDNFRIGK
jgi:hypothetical protein